MPQHPFARTDPLAILCLGISRLYHSWTANLTFTGCQRDLYAVFGQAGKSDPEQPNIASVLPAFDPAASIADACIVGCGPAGLALAAELGAQGVAVVIVGVCKRLTHLICKAVSLEATALESRSSVFAQHKPSVVLLLCF